MRKLFVIVLLVLAAGCSTRALALDLDLFHPPDMGLQFRPYAGIGISRLHHTGFDADRLVNFHPVQVEQWELGGKAFMGAQILKWAAIEGAFHYLGSSPYLGASPTAPAIIRVPGQERSQAVAVSFLAFTKPITHFWIPLKLYARVGGAYKHTSDDNGAGLVQREGGLAYLVGGGMEFMLGPNLFARVEYEYLSKSGSSRAINAQHTPISFSLGAYY
jgi:hypothetical protein